MEKNLKARKQSYVIVGTGGFAIELSGLIRKMGMEINGFIGPNKNDSLSEKWLGSDDYLKNQNDHNFLIAIGDPLKREEIFLRLRKMKHKVSIFMDDSAYISDSSSIGVGSIVYPNSTIHAKVEIGEGVLVNSNSTIGHETSIDSFSNVGPSSSIGGKCNIGKRVYLGIGCSIIENISIADDVYIGAGAVVNKNITEKGTYVGVPVSKI